MGQEPAAPAEGEPKAPETEPKDNANTPEPESPESPKTFDADYVKSLRSENAAARKARQELEAKLTEYEERDKSELEKLTGKLTKAERDKAEAEAKLLRFEIAAEKQVPADALDLLTGTTREELEAKADKLLELVKSRNESEKTPDFDGGAREPADNSDPVAAHNDVILKLAGIRN
jgi:NADPH-dependent glutamate synthase beta subunit-like oxidoreductase